MCTVTWWLAPDGGYEVFFNRDERRTRGPAEAPALAHGQKVDYLAPTDADFGGTWLLVNAYGLTLALMNHYPVDPRKPVAPSRSRGQLPRKLADCATVAEVRALLNPVELSHYSACFLFAFERGKKPGKWMWDTRNLLEDAPAEPLPFFTSSSFRGEDVRRHRREVFAKNFAAKGLSDPANLEQFHLYQEKERPAFGILMDRSDARTVSFSHITVGSAQEVVFSYRPRAVGDGTLPEPAVVARLALHVPLASNLAP